MDRKTNHPLSKGYVTISGSVWVMGGHVVTIVLYEWIVELFPWLRWKASPAARISTARTISIWQIERTKKSWPFLQTQFSHCSATAVKNKIKPIVQNTLLVTLGRKLSFIFWNVSLHCFHICWRHTIETEWKQALLFYRISTLYRISSKWAFYFFGKTQIVCNHGFAFEIANSNVIR